MGSPFATAMSPEINSAQVVLQGESVANNPDLIATAPNPASLEG